MNFARLNPPDVLDKILSIFPFVRRIDQSSGGHPVLEPIRDRYMFMHDHVVKRGCIDDLLCTYIEESPVPSRE
jgi:hypothetical protein